MAPYRRAYNFTGEPGANEDATDWLSALETNIYSCMTNREKVDLFSSKLWRGSPARKWFNKLPDEGHRRWHLVKQEFQSRWCQTADTSNIVALLSTDNPVDPHSAPDSSASPEIYAVLNDPIPTLSKLLAARDVHGVFNFCQQTADSEHGKFALVWDLAFQAGKSFAQGETVSPSCKKPTVATSEPASATTPPTVPILPPISEPSQRSARPTPTAITAAVSILPGPSPSTKLSWADDCTSLPVIPLVKTPRNISCLRSGNKPFGTLQHRNRRHSQITQRVSVPPHSFPSVRACASAPVYLIPSRRMRSSPPAVYTNAAPSISLALDWDRDPRLFELTRILRSLGLPPSWTSA